MGYTARMAKAQSDKSEKAEGGLLEVAWKAYGAGDLVTARRAAQLLLAGAAKDADEALAKKVGKELFTPDYVADARTVAAELVMRTKTPPKPFLLMGAALLIWVVLLLIANRG